MTGSISWQIPHYTLRLLDRAPHDRPVAMLLRHSVRDSLPADGIGYHLPITEVGRQLAHQLGASLGARLRTLHTSPFVRCIETAEALQTGAARELSIVTDRLLGDPGVYVIDPRLAWANWRNLGHEGVMESLISDADPLPGVARPDDAARRLVHHMLSVAGDNPGVHVFVTHDLLVLATASRILGQRLARDTWPLYLEGAFFWRSDHGLHAAYRDFEVIHP